MEEQAAVAKELERLRLRQKQAYEQTTDLIDKLISILQQTKSSIHPAPTPMTIDAGNDALQPVLAPLASGPLLTPMMQQVQELQVAQKLSNEQKDMNATIARVIKAIERGFPSEIPEFLSEHLPLDPKLLAQTVLHHLLKTGRVETARAFAAAAQLPFDPEEFNELAGLRAVLASLDASDLRPAIEWAEKRRVGLDAARSPLLFQLHRGAFIQLLSADRLNALVYARKNFSSYAVQHQKEVRRLFCSLAFATRLSASPYRDLVWANLHRDLGNLFRSAVSSVFNISCDSPLLVTVETGLSALPAHLKMHSALKLKPSELSTRIPVEVELTREQRFHSVFTCPVSREQTVPENPPMLLQCGHVISRSSMLKLGRGAAQRFKCPYCPMEQTVSVYIWYIRPLAGPCEEPVCGHFCVKRDLEPELLAAAVVVSDDSLSHMSTPPPFR